MIRLVFPELTEERRKELTKEVKKKAEASKVAIRNIRRDAMDAVKKAEKANEITEDTLTNLEEEIQKLIDERTAAKKSKDFARADEIRNELLEKGVVIEDTRAGVRWSYK